MSYADILTADRRLVILQALSTMADYTTNEVVLSGWLGQHGHKVSRDLLRNDLAWLDEQGLIVPQQVQGVWIVTLGARGYDVAQGAAQVPGVARPRPN
jgi:hypothetical protein